jgi:hypothetical protein
MSRIQPLASVACAALLFSSSAFAAVQKDAGLIHWNGKSFAANAIPGHMPAVDRALLGKWAPFAEQMDYRMDLDDSGRVLLLSSSRHKRVSHEMRLIEKTLDLFDEKLPPTIVPATTGLEDVVLGNGEQTLRKTEPMVLVRARNRADYWRLTEFVAERHNYLKSWVDGAQQDPGFQLSVPLCAAWLETEHGMEEFRADNELVNRLSQGLLQTRFGHQPQWMSQGVAWYTELEVARSIYAFPSREGFVSIGEHSGWLRSLKKTYSKQKGQDLAMNEIATWSHGTYDEECAARSFGLVSFLAEHETDALARIAAELGAHRDTFGRVQLGDGRWTMDTTYNVPVREQGQMLVRHAGDNVMHEATRFFLRGKSYRRPREKR